jgi:hypothetical protein
MSKTNLVCDKRLNKYFSITKKALAVAKKSINKSKKGKQEKEKERIILDMAQRYYDDALWFKKKGDYVNAFACLNYAHGWLDCGSKLGIFNVKDSSLFVLK